MSRPVSLLTSSPRKLELDYKPISDQTYYLYFRRLVEAFEQAELAKRAGDTSLQQEWEGKRAAIEDRIKLADRPCPSYQELKDQGKIRIDKPPKKVEVKDETDQPSAMLQKLRSLNATE